MRLYLKDKIIKYNLILALLMNALLWVLFYFRIPITLEPIILRFNIYVGISLIGPWFDVFYFPLAGLGIIIINLLIGWMLFRKDKLPAHFLIMTALAVQIILLIFGSLIVMMNA